MAYWIFYSLGKSEMPQYVALLASFFFLPLLPLVFFFFCIFIAARRIVNCVNAIAVQERNTTTTTATMWRFESAARKKINISYVFMYLWIGPEQCEIFLILSWHHIKDSKKKEKYRKRSENPSYRADVDVYAQRQRGRMTRAAYRKWATLHV